MSAASSSGGETLDGNVLDRRVIDAVERQAAVRRVRLVGARTSCVQVPPDSLDTAIASYLVARARLEHDLGATVPRILGREALGALHENGVSEHP